MGGSQRVYMGGRFYDIWDLCNWKHLGDKSWAIHGREVMRITWGGFIYGQYMEGKPCEIHGRKVI